MKKNRGKWAALASAVLSVLVMAGLFASAAAMLSGCGSTQHSKGFDEAD